MTLVQNEAAAQAVLLPPQPLGMDPAYVGRLRIVPTSVQSVAEVRSQVGSAPSATSAPLTAGAGLSSFKLQFHNGDHGVRVISVLKMSNGMADARLHDANSDDPFGGYASWWLIPDAIGGEVSGSGSSSNFVSMNVPPGPPNHVLVLGGFSVEVGGTRTNFDIGDTQISRIEFSANDTNVRPTISARVITSNDRPLSFRAQYVWVPRTAIVGVRNVRNENNIVSGVGGSRGDSRVRAVSTTTGQNAETDRYVIRSFDFEFKNGVRNLLNIGVHLNGERDVATIPEAISWQDNNRDDSIRWLVNFYNIQ